MKNAISLSFVAIGIKHGVDWLLTNHVSLNEKKKQHPPHFFTIAFKNALPFLGSKHNIGVKNFKLCL